MKKLLGVVFLVVIGISVSILLGLPNQPKQLQQQVLSATISPTPTGAMQDIPGIPQKITIPAINVSAVIESVGVDEKGRMDVPKEVQNTAWYQKGAKPGQQGSAVIAGHFDTKTGAPAVFYDVSTLQTGDRIMIVDDKDTTYTFIVTHKQSYDYDKLPLTAIFTASDKKRLNLITCEGVFDQQANNYSKRTVVYAEMEK